MNGYPVRIMRRLSQIFFVVLACFLLAAAAIGAIGFRDHIANSDMIVVPGNSVALDGSPSPRLKARLDVALRLFQERRAPLIFVSGGTGREGIDEAISMANYLLKNGVPPSAIVKDSFGVDTAATALNASLFMRAHKLKSAMVATQYFHIARTKLALERSGIQVVGTVHAHYAELRDIYSTAREVIALAVYCVTLPQAIPLFHVQPPDS